MKQVALLGLVGTLLTGGVVAIGELGSGSNPVKPAIPGAYNRNVSPESLSKTICRVGWTKTIRPPVSYTDALKRAQIASLGYSDTNPSHYEEDHLISLELGGSPTSRKNLWPQPWSQAKKDDRLENQWHAEVCAHRLTLNQGREMESAWKSNHG